MRVLIAAAVAGMALAAPAQAEYCEGFVDTNCTTRDGFYDECEIYVSTEDVIGEGQVCKLAGLEDPPGGS